MSLQVDLEAAELLEDISSIAEIANRLIRASDTDDKFPGEESIKVTWRTRFHLRNVVNVLEATKQQILDGRINREFHQKLKQYIRSCSDKAVALDALLQKGIPITNASMLGRFFGQIYGLRMDDQVDVLVDGILDDVRCYRNDSLLDADKRDCRSRESLLLTQWAYNAAFTNYALLRERETEAEANFADSARSMGMPQGQKLPESVWTNYAALRQHEEDDSTVEALFSTPRTQSSYSPSIDIERYGVKHSNLTSYVHTSLVPFLPYVEKLENTAEIPTSYIYALPDPKRIRLDTLRDWIKSCDLHHTGHCQILEVNDGPVLKPLWFIDVNRSCLVSSKRSYRYVALSYVWSHSEATSTTLSNVGILQREEALLDQGVKLPLTVEHVITLTRLLGETYLWVDRFCIVQDDDKTKSQQLNSMAEVYANSYFTIVAAQGNDAGDGLRGVRDVTGPRQLSRRSRLGLSRYQNHYEALSIQAMRLMRTNWYDRGWTFQEHLFSRRKLVFHNNTVNWECHCAAWHEDQHVRNDLSAMQPCRKKCPTSQLDINNKTWPNFHRYARLVSLYNHRSLTFPEDVLDAFAGVTNTLGPWFDGGFLCGLPQMFFDAALLWQPYQPLRRRQGLRTTKSIPSWSWIGWQGNLHSESWRSGYDYIKGSSEEQVEINGEVRTVWEHPSWRTYSTVDWHYSENLDSRRYPVTITSQKFRRQDDETVTNLPEGWSKHRRDGGNYYKHTSDPDQEFWYPVPLPGSFTADPPPVQPTYLHARTRSCSLRLGANFTNSETSKCLSYDLVDAGGEWVGVLRLNLHASAKSVDKQTGSECLLVEMSSGSVRDQRIEAVSFDEWHRPDCPRTSGLYEFYNVLQVKMGEGVGYRMALGRVVKKVWDELAQAVDLSLG